MAGSSSARKARKFHSRWMEVTVACLPANMLTALPKTDQSTSHSNTCRTSGSGWSGRSSTESSCEDRLISRHGPCGGLALCCLQLETLETAAPNPLFLLSPWSWTRPWRDAFTSTSAFPFVSQILFLQRNFGAVKGVRDIPKLKRETAFHFFSSAILFSKGSSLSQSLVRGLREAWKDSWFHINSCC